MKEMLRQVRAQRRVRFFPGKRLQYAYHQTSDGQIFLADPLSYLRVAQGLRMSEILREALSDAVRKSKETAAAPADCPEPEKPLLREKEAQKEAEASAAQLKHEVTERIRAYRDRNGLGSLQGIARYLRKITVSDLRDIINGAAHLQLDQWRRIAVAVSKAEAAEKEQTDAE